MTTSFDFDRLLGSVLEDGPQTAPPAVVEGALTRASVVTQRRAGIRALDRHAWPTGHRHERSAGVSVLPAASGRTLLLGLLVLALVAIGLAGASALRRDPSPMAPLRESAFVVPFEYSVPPGSLIRSTVSNSAMVAWVGGPDVVPSPFEAGNPAQQPAPSNVRGIIIGRGSEAWSHSSSGRFMLRTSPAGFLLDLREIANVSMGTIEQTTLDGRTALVTSLPGAGGTDIHVTGHMQGLGSISSYAIVNLPSSLIVADIDGTTVFILIWARTVADLETWLPQAHALVDSIHFLPEGQP